jgi:hypothetical protein
LQRDIAERPPIERRSQAYARYHLNLAAREVIISEEVPGTSIVGAYRLRRRWLGVDYQDGMEFYLETPFIPNYCCTYRASQYDRGYRTALRLVDERVAPYKNLWWRLKPEMIDDLHSKGRAAPKWQLTKREL